MLIYSEDWVKKNCKGIYWSLPPSLTKTVEEMKEAINHRINILETIIIKACPATP